MFIGDAGINTTSREYMDQRSWVRVRVQDQGQKLNGKIRKHEVYIIYLTRKVKCRFKSKVPDTNTLSIMDYHSDIHVASERLVVMVIHFVLAPQNDYACGQISHFPIQHKKIRATTLEV